MGWKGCEVGKGVKDGGAGLVEGDDEAVAAESIDVGGADGGPLKAPFPAFGGKSKIAAMVWERFGTGGETPRNYIEPFCFSGAMTLGRPLPGGSAAGLVETLNDRNVFVTNFWRAVIAAPELVAQHADWPVHECDLHARHRWLVTSGEARALLERVKQDADFYDARIAGWWCWGACCWIGSGWCDERSDEATEEGSDEGEDGTWKQKPRMGDPGSGVHAPGGTNGQEKRPQLCNGNTSGGPGVLGVLAVDREHMPNMERSRLIVSPPTVPNISQRIPLLRDFGGTGTGVTREPPADTGRPAITDEFSRGRGVNGGMDDMTCERRREWVTAWMLRLKNRLRSVRVCCGHWSRVCDSPSTMTRLGTTAVFLDPPYRTTLGCGKVNRTKHIYANDRNQDVNALCDEVQAWCLKWGSDPMVRIALCGLEGEYPEIEKAGWEVVAWKSNGGYGNRKGAVDNENAKRERVWFSPHCVRPKVKQGGLFG